MLVFKAGFNHLYIFPGFWKDALGDLVVSLSNRVNSFVFAFLILAVMALPAQAIANMTLFINGTNGAGVPGINVTIFNWTAAGGYSALLNATTNGTGAINFTNFATPANITWVAFSPAANVSIYNVTNNTGLIFAAAQWLNLTQQGYDNLVPNTSIVNLTPMNWTGPFANTGNHSYISQNQMYFLNVSVASNSGVYQCWMTTPLSSTYSMTYNSTTQSCISSPLLFAIGPGTANYSVNFSLTSGSGMNASNTSYYLWYVNALPSLSVVTPVNSTAFSNTSTVNYNISVTDAQMNLTGGNCSVYYNYTLVNKTAIADLYGGHYCVGSFLMANIPETYYVFNVSTSDFLSNLGYSSSYLGSDNNLPVLTLLNPAQGQIITTYYRFNATMNDTLNTTLGYFNVTRDGAAMIVASPTFTGNVSWFNTSASLADGFHWVAVSANDSANHFVHTNVTFTMDVLAPNITIVSNNTFHRSNTSMLINASVVDLGTNVTDCNITVIGATLGSIPGTVSNGFCSANYDLTGATAGYHLINISANDFSRNINNSLGAYLFIDDTAPVLVVDTTYLGRAYSATFPIPHINASITDANASAYNCTLYIGGTAASTAAPNAFGCNFTNVVMPSFASDGLKTVNVTLVDNAGNLGYNDSTYVYADKTAPLVNISAPSNGTTVSGIVQINGSASDAGDAVSGYMPSDTYTLNYRIWGSQGNWTAFYTAAYNATLPAGNFTNSSAWNTTGLADGWYVVNVTARDFVGNINNSVSTMYYVGNYNMNASLTATPAFYSSSVTINGSAVNGTGANSALQAWNLTASLSNSTTYAICNSTTANATFSCVWNASAVADGNYTLDLSLNSTTNKSSKAQLGFIAVDHQAPSAQSATVSPSTGTTNSTYAFNVTLLDAGVGSQNATATLYNSTTSTSVTCTLSQFAGTNVWGCTGVALPAVGVYNAGVTAYDSLGNTNLTNFTSVATVTNYSYAFVGYSVSPSSTVGSNLITASGYVDFASIAGVDNTTGAPSVNLSLSWCGTVYYNTTNNTGFFTSSVVVASNCTVNATVVGTTVWKSLGTVTYSAPTPTPSSSSSSTTTYTDNTAYPTPSGSSSTPTPVPTARPVATPTPVSSASPRPTVVASAPTAAPTAVSSGASATPIKVNTATKPADYTWLIVIVILAIVVAFLVFRQNAGGI